jgi:hypothetical protein
MMQDFFFGVAMFLVGLFLGRGGWLRSNMRSEEATSAEINGGSASATGEKKADTDKLEWLATESLRVHRAVPNLSISRKLVSRA